MSDHHAGSAERILILAPTPSDASWCERFLLQAQLQPQVCEDTAALRRILGEPAAALVLADEALRGDAGACIREHFAQQEDWLSLPLIVLTRRLAAMSPELLDDYDLYGHIRLIERPVNSTVFVNAVKMALRERRQQYRILDLLNERAEHIAQRDEFLATLGHELRNPLAAIMTCSELLDTMPLKASPAGRYLNIISTQSAQIKRLLDDLSDVSRIARRKLSLQCEPLELAITLREAVAQARSTIDESRQQLELDISDEAMPLLADATRLRQIFANLLVNASRYSPPEGLIRLSAHRRDGLAEVCISDQGIGMSAETRARIFEPFYQAPQRSGDPRVTRSGLGVGLTLARSLVEQHAGTIRADSEGPGRGSQFSVSLPLQTAPQSETSPQQQAPEQTPAFRAQRILLIEDNLDFGMGLKRLLELRGHQVELAADGPAGVAAAESHRPEVVVLDIGLPGLDGYQVASRLRSLKGLETLRIIAVTGFGREIDRSRSQMVGIDRHLVKPVTVPELEAAIAGIDRFGAGFA